MQSNNKDIIEINDKINQANIIEKNIDNLRRALLKAADTNNKFFSDDIEDPISLRSIKKLAEIEISKIESQTSYTISIVGITLAFVGIGISEFFLGISLNDKLKKFSSSYIIGGLCIFVFAFIFDVGAHRIKMKRMIAIDFFYHIILKIERRFA